jgi:cytochrome P450 family 6
MLVNTAQAMHEISIGLAFPADFSLIFKTPTGPDECLVAFRPALVLRDPELIKEILVKEFNTFYNRNAHTNHEKDPLSQNLFLLKGELWRLLRLKLSPVFTSFRLKQMFPLINTCGKQLRQYIERSDKQIEVKETAGKYATDVITTCAFGIESNSLMNPNAEFREFGRKIFEFSVYRSFEFMSAFMLPLVVKLMGITFFSTETTKFMRKTIWETIQEREEKKIERHDFLQLLIKLKNGEDLTTNENSKKNGPSTETLSESTATSNGIVKGSKVIRKCSNYTSNIT